MIPIASIEKKSDLSRETDTPLDRLAKEWVGNPVWKVRYVPLIQVELDCKSHPIDMDPMLLRSSQTFTNPDHADAFAKEWKRTMGMECAAKWSKAAHEIITRFHRRLGRVSESETYNASLIRDRKVTIQILDAATKHKEIAEWIQTHIGFPPREGESALAPYVAVDCEFAERRKLSLLQLGIEHHICVINFDASRRSQRLLPSIINLLETEMVSKIFFDPSAEFRFFQPHITIRAVVDLQFLVQRHFYARRISLVHSCAHLLGWHDVPVLDAVDHQKWGWYPLPEPLFQHAVADVHCIFILYKNVVDFFKLQTVPGASVLPSTENQAKMGDVMHVWF